MLEFGFDFPLSCFDLEGSFDLNSSKMNLGFLDCMCFFDRFFGHFSDRFPVDSSDCRCICLDLYFEILFHENLENIRVGSVLDSSFLARHICLGIGLQLVLGLAIRLLLCNIRLVFCFAFRLSIVSIGDLHLRCPFVLHLWISKYLYCPFGVVRFLYF